MSQRTQWWSLPEKSADIAGAIRTLRERIKSYDTDRQLDLAAMRAMYLDIPNDRYERWAFHRERRSRNNLIQGSVDGVHAQIVTHRIRPRVVTNGGSWEAQQKAKKRQLWIDGQWDELDVHAHLDEFALDSLVTGTGILKVGVEDGMPTIEPVWAGDVWVDPREERYRRKRVRTFYHTHRIQREVLQALYPEHHDALEDVAGADDDDTSMFPDLELKPEDDWSSPDDLEVTEAWRCAVRDKPISRKDSEGNKIQVGSGRYVIVVGDLVLDDQPWNRKSPPLVCFQWAPAMRFWGQGLVERASGMQSDLNELTEIIQETYGTFVPQLWVDESAEIESTSLNDVVGKVNRFRGGGAPINNFVAILSGEVSQGLLNREETIANRFMRNLGVDTLGAQAEKPPGLNSGEALRNYKDFTSQRFISPQRRFETAAIELAELLFYFGEKLARDGHRQSVYTDSDGLHEVDLADYLTEEGETFKVKLKPGSALPKDISGRVQTVLDMQAAGIPMDPVQLAELLDVPDFDAYLERLTAGRNLVRNAIETCGDLDEDQPAASTFWPRQWALTEIQTEVQLAEMHGADERILERMRLLHAHLLSLPDPNAPPPAAPGLGPAGPPEPAAPAGPAAPVGPPGSVMPGAPIQ